jgi:peroxiredoxin
MQTTSSERASGRRAVPLHVGDRLPDRSVERTDGAGQLPVKRRGRDSTILLMLHAANCPACRGYVGRLQDEAAAIRDWDGRVLLVWAAPVARAAATARVSGFDSGIDVDGGLLARLGLELPAILIADQWGELFAVQPAGNEHDFIDPSEVVEWLRFLAIQCPECQGEAY